MKDNIIYSYDVRPQHLEIEAEIRETIERVYQAGIFVGGKEVLQFEEAFRKYLNADNVVSCASGTDALELILRAIGLKPEEEVLVPANTWISVAEAVTMAGGKVRFVDVDPLTGNMDPESLSEQINERCRAVIVVHMHGRMVDIKTILNLSATAGLVVIEDCAHAAGASLEGRKSGTWADYGAYSFYPTKNLGALGDGGAVVCRDNEMAEKIRLMTNHGQQKRDVHLIPGKTSRLDTLQAALLSLKLKYLDSWNDERKWLAGIYSDSLASVNAIKPPVISGSMVYHHYIIQTEQASSLKEYLFDRSINCSVHYPTPLHLVPAYNNHRNQRGDYPIAEKRAESILTLPLYPGLTRELQNRVIKNITEFFDITHF